MTTPDAKGLSRISVWALIALAAISWLSFIAFFVLFALNGFSAERMISACAALGASGRDAVIDAGGAFGSSCRDAVVGLWPYLMTGPGLLIGLGSLLSLFALVRAVAVGLSTRRSVSGFLPGEPPEDLNRVLAEMKAKLDLVILNDSRPIAFTVGIRQPRICLSTGLINSLNEAGLKAVLAHERAHIERRDNLYIFIASIARDLLAIIPLSHYLYRLFYREKELAADAVAAESTGDPTGLASAIVAVSRLSTEGFNPAPAYSTFFPRRQTVEMRVRSLLGQPATGRANELRRAGLALLASLLVAGAVAGAALALPARPVMTAADCDMNGTVCRTHPTGSADCCLHDTTGASPPTNGKTKAAAAPRQP